MAKASIAFCSIIWHAAAKARVEIFTQHFAAQVGPYRIRANCIAPETIPTQRNKRRIPEPRHSALCELYPLRRLGPPPMGRSPPFISPPTMRRGLPASSSTSPAARRAVSLAARPSQRSSPGLCSWHLLPPANVKQMNEPRHRPATCAAF